MQRKPIFTYFEIFLNPMPFITEDIDIGGAARRSLTQVEFAHNTFKQRYFLFLVASESTALHCSLRLWSTFATLEVFLALINPFFPFCVRWGKCTALVLTWQPPISRTLQMNLHRFPGVDCASAPRQHSSGSSLTYFPAECEPIGF